ncbi:MAG TPA: ABC transporter ATP-binding protein [Kofleriaceae bacterium]|jgi:glycerol transport system ATP-binding protein|nr:ABC transporter ATP-binding protein [Kofleriaceae bacterium]
MAEIVLGNISHSYQLPRGSRERTRRGGEPSWALRDVELRWRDGGAYALLGPSGCGKTTLLGIISGLIQPTRGRVLYGGRDVTDASSRDRNIAQVFQFPVVYDTMTVRDNLAFPLRNRGLAAAEIDRRVARIAEALDLGALLALRATGLTADQKQILALGRGLVRDDVAAILFDEPLTVIDPHRKWLLRRKLKEIHRQFRHTLVYVTHDQTEALTFADEVVVMQTGQVLQQGTPEQLFLQPAHTYVGYFIGSPGMNVLPCTVDPGDPPRARIGEHAIALPPGVDPAQAGGGFELGIRPEHIVVQGGAGLPLVVTAVEDHGRFRIVSARLDRLPVKLRIGDAQIAVPEVGQTLHVEFPPDRICLYRDGRIVMPVMPVMPVAPVAPAAGAP